MASQNIGGPVSTREQTVLQSKFYEIQSQLDLMEKSFETLVNRIDPILLRLPSAEKSQGSIVTTAPTPVMCSLLSDLGHVQSRLAAFLASLSNVTESVNI